MSEVVKGIERRGFRAPGTGLMVGGGLIGALGAYLFQVYGARTLGEDAFAPVSLLWTLFFILAAILLIPVEQYVTREVARGRKALPTDLRPAMVMAGIASVLGAGYVLIALDRAFNGDAVYALLIVLLCVVYTGLFIGKGVLAGSRQFGNVGWLLIFETTVRAVAGVVFLTFALDATSLGWAMVAGGAATLSLGWWRSDNGDASLEPSPARGFLLGYVGGSSSAQILLAGAPLAVDLLGAPPAVVSITFYTFTLFRAPLTLIFALQGRILPHLVGLARSGHRTELASMARKVVLYGAFLALVGGVVGWSVGPTVVTVLFRSAMEPPALLTALVAAGAVAATATQLASQVLVAGGRTRPLGMAWFGGLVVAAIVILMASGAPEIRVAIGFAAGQGVALGVMAHLATRP